MEVVEEDAEDRRTPPRRDEDDDVLTDAANPDDDDRSACVPNLDKRRGMREEALREATIMLCDRLGVVRGCYGGKQKWCDVSGRRSIFCLVAASKTARMMSWWLVVRAISKDCEERASQ